MPKTQYTVRIEEKYLEKSKIIADKEMRSLNNLIEYFVAQSVEEYEKNNGIILIPDKS